MEELRNWVSQRFRPKILIISSPDAQITIAKNKLTPSELFQPFSYISQSFTIKSLTPLPITITNFQVQFIQSFQRPPQQRLLHQYLPECDWHGQFVSSVQQIPSYLQTCPTPWYSKWEQNFLKNLDFSSHQLIDMPIAIIYIVSTAQEDPCSSIKQLTNQNNLPFLYHSRNYDSQIPKAFMVIHDVSTSSLTQTQSAVLHEKIQKMCSPCLTQWQLLNGGENQSDQFWEMGKGEFVSLDQKRHLVMFVEELITRVIVPHIVQTVKRYDSFLDQKKRGLRNSFKSFFQKSGERQEQFKFQVGSVDHVGRHIADLLFIIKDYQNALAHYRSSASDFKKSKAFLHAAAALEMQAITILLYTGDTKQAEQSLEAACQMALNADNKKYLARSVIIWKRVFTYLGKHQKVIDKLLNMGPVLKGEIPYIYGLFLEQISISYLNLNTPKIRKYAFYQILAGNQYRENKMGMHSLYCYYSGSHLYQGKKLQHVSMHIFNMLGRFCYYLNKQIQAVHFYLRLAQCKRLLFSGDDQQKKIMNQLIGAIKKWNQQLIRDDFNPIDKVEIEFQKDGLPVIPFSLPQVKKFIVILPQDKVQNYSQSQFKAVSTDWKNLLSKQFSCLEREFEILDNLKTKGFQRSLYAGESVLLEVTLKNPFDIPFKLENIHICGQYEGTADIQNVDTIVIQPKSEIKTKLHITPFQQGKVNITGIQWTISNTFHGKKNISSQQIIVKPPSSNLEVQIREFPDLILLGEVRSVILSIKNTQLNPVQSVKLRVSHQFMFGQQQFLIGNLDLSQQKIFTIWIRGQHIGYHNLRFLVLYKSNNHQRYLRLQAFLTVKHSLNIQSRVQHSIKNPNDNIIQLSVYSQIGGTPILKQVSALSAHSLNLITKIEDEIFYFNVKQGLDNQDVQMTSDMMPVDVRQGFCWEVHRTLKEKQPSTGIDLLVSWELHTDQVYSGHHYLHGINFFKQPTNLPLHVMIDSQTLVDHDFSELSLLKIPVTVYLKNILPDVFSFMLEALDSDTVANETETQNLSKPHFFWDGVTRKQVDLKPEEVKSIKFQVVFQSSGCYNINRLAIILPETPCKQLIDYQHWVIINAINQDQIGKQLDQDVFKR